MLTLVLVRVGTLVNKYEVRRSWGGGMSIAFSAPSCMHSRIFCPAPPSRVLWNPIAEVGWVGRRLSSGAARLGDVVHPAKRRSREHVQCCVRRSLTAARRQHRARWRCSNLQKFV